MGGRGRCALGVAVVCLAASPASAAAGDLDGTFGTGGTVTTDFAGNGDEARAVALQPDGKIVAAGGALGATAASALVCAATAATASLAAPAYADGLAPSYVTFDKHYVGAGQFEGTTGGAAPGTVHTTCNLTPHNPVLVQLTCDWQISAGQHSFDASLTGTLNWQTGEVVMNGHLATGWQAGAQVHETGHLVDAATLEFAGIIRIQP